MLEPVTTDHQPEAQHLKSSGYPEAGPGRLPHLNGAVPTGFSRAEFFAFLAHLRHGQLDLL
jgi:hypothetical protein